MLKELRLKANLTQKEVANKLNVSEALISLYESGDRKPPIKKIKELAAILGATIEEIIACF